VTSTGKTPANADAVVLRAFASRSDYDQAVTLQRDTWGQDFTECVPASILQISQKVGGVAAGAFDAANRLIGFVYGISGLRDGRPAHWSHMLAVYPEYRGRRLGTRLKALQRDLLLAEGIDVAYWTYDPLIAGNAHLNINLLGALPIEYVPDMYGSNTGSDLHSGLGTDRFVVEWNLASMPTPATSRVLRLQRFGWRSPWIFKRSSTPI
jgi:predicted GNAT superfamily acetyltransferase